MQFLHDACDTSADEWFVRDERARSAAQTGRLSSQRFRKCGLHAVHDEHLSSCSEVSPISWRAMVVKSDARPTEDDLNAISIDVCIVSADEWRERDDVRATATDRGDAQSDSGMQISKCVVVTQGSFAGRARA